MAVKRKTYGAELKAKVLLETLHGERAVAELVANCGAHQSLINTRTRQSPAGLSCPLSGGAEGRAAEKEVEIETQPPKTG